MTTDKQKEKEKKEQNKSGAEKPVSLWGASFQDVVQALLKTKPMPKEEEKTEKRHNTKDG